MALRSWVNVSYQGMLQADHSQAGRVMTLKDIYVLILDSCEDVALYDMMTNFMCQLD